jgi:hypothetical protein
MTDPRLAEIARLLDPKPGTRQWSGGATPRGCLRGVSPEQAAWKPGLHRHSIWELTLHLAYWKYAVRRKLEGAPMGGFPRSPSNWPSVPGAADTKSWNEDRALLKTEHQRLVTAVRALSPKRLDGRVPVMHDTYHVGQVQLLKRLYQDRAATGA